MAPAERASLRAHRQRQTRPCRLRPLTHRPYCFDFSHLVFLHTCVPFRFPRRDSFFYIRYILARKCMITIQGLQFADSGDVNDVGYHTPFNLNTASCTKVEWPRSAPLKEWIPQRIAAVIASCLVICRSRVVFALARNDAHPPLPSCTAPARTSYNSVAFVCPLLA